MSSNKEVSNLFLDKYLSSLNVYWGALLTINGLLLSFFSIDSLKVTNYTPYANYALVILCSISLILIIFNFRTIKKNYYEIATTENNMPDVPHEALKAANSEDEKKRVSTEFKDNLEEWSKNDLQKTRKRQRYTKMRETSIEILLLFEIILVWIILFTSHVSENTFEEKPQQFQSDSEVILQEI